MSDGEKGIALIALGIVGMLCGIPNMGWLIVIGVVFM